MSPALDYKSVTLVGRFGVPCMLMSDQTRCCNLIDGLRKFGCECRSRSRLDLHIGAVTVPGLFGS